MKQVVLVEPQRFEVRETKKPVPGRGQALIKVKAVGICGSDIHAYYGKHPFIQCPIVLGHEMTGEVVGLGEGCAKLKVGDRVVLRPQEVCGECRMCREGRYNICQELKVLGCQDTGAGSEYYAADEALLYHIPEELEYDTATLIEPLAVGVHAVKRPAGGVEGKNVVVIGAGTIGNVVAQAAMAFGARSVLISDVSQEKLDTAAKCGIKLVVNAADEDIVKAVEKHFQGEGADVVFECSANGAALNQALEYARKGTDIVIVGVFGSQTVVNMANVQDREYRLIGSLMYVHEDYVDAIKLSGGGRINLKALISKEFALSCTQEAYKYIGEHKDSVNKVVLTV